MAARLTREDVAARREARMAQHRCKKCGAALMSAENVHRYTKAERKQTSRIVEIDGVKGRFTISGHTCGNKASKAYKRGRVYDLRDAKYAKQGLLG